MTPEGALDASHITGKTYRNRILPGTAGQVSAATNYNFPLATQSLRVLPLPGQHYQAHQERKVQVCSSIVSSY